MGQRAWPWAIGAFVWHAGFVELAKARFYDWLIHMIKPHEATILTHVVQYGISAVLLGAAIYFFGHGRWWGRADAQVFSEHQAERAWIEPRLKEIQAPTLPEAQLVVVSESPKPRFTGAILQKRSEIYLELLGILGKAEKGVRQDAEMLAYIWQDDILKEGPGFFYKKLVAMHAAVTQVFVQMEKVTAIDNQFDDIVRMLGDAFRVQAPISDGFQVFIAAVNSLPEPTPQKTLVLIQPQREAYLQTTLMFGRWISDMKVKITKRSTEEAV